MTIDKYALIAKGSTYVENTIIAEDDLILEGYTLIAIGEDEFCEPGNYYNAKDGKFYADEEFIIDPAKVELSGSVMP